MVLILRKMSGSFQLFVIFINYLCDLNMDKKSLLFFFAACVMVLSAGAQSRKSDAPRQLQRPSLSRVKSQANVSAQEMPLRRPGAHVAAPASDNAPLKPFYRRPAGAFYCPELAVNGVGGYTIGHDIVLFKPYAEYTFYTTVQGADSNTDYAWDVYAGSDDYTPVDHKQILKWAYDMSIQPMPVFYAVDGPLDDPMTTWYSYQMPYYSTSNGTVVDNPRYAEAWAVPNPDVVFNNYNEKVEFLLSSKTACLGGRNRDLNYTWTDDFYTGAMPFVYDPTGRWFGKNTKHVDGMAQAFERPEHPYLLKKVCMRIGSIVCSAPVTLTCKVYRLEDIPPYRDEGCVTLPEEPGRLIAIGKGTVDPMTYEEKNGLVEFELFGFEEDDPDLIYESYFTIDYPILVSIEGYNDPAATALEDFTAYICADYNEDEGYGELAYLKTPINDDDENFTGQYEWTGLNHFYHDWEIKTGFSIFIVADQPFITFNYKDEDGEYVFPSEGGPMQQYISIDDPNPPGLLFYSWTSCEDEGWTVTCQGEEPPEWLNIELHDCLYNGEFDNTVGAWVVADPLPNGVSYREAVVRFECPGAYIDYMFIQGEMIDPINPPEPPFIMINKIIDLIIKGDYESKYDVDGNGEINITDLNLVVDYALR